MEQATADQPQKRSVSAPQPDNSLPSTSLISVTLEEDEDVEWQWMHRDGRSVVTGYRIVKGTP